MPQELYWDVLLRHARSANLRTLGLCILHTAAYTRPDDAQLQLCEYRAHLNERLAHRVNLSCAAIDCDAADDYQPQPLLRSAL